MKKIMCAFVALFMFFALVGCGGKEASIVGKWHPEGEDESFYFEFKENNEMSVGISGFTADGTYQLDGDKITLKISMLGETIMDDEGTYKINGDKLTITIDGDAQDFTKVKE